MGPIVLTGTLVRRLLPRLHLQFAQRQFIAPVHASTVRNGQVTINLAPYSNPPGSKNKKNRWRAQRTQLAINYFLARNV